MLLNFEYYKCKVFRAYCIGSGGYTDNANDIADWKNRKKISTEDADRLTCLNERLNRLFTEGSDTLCSEKK